MPVDQSLAGRVRDAITDLAVQRGLPLREKNMFGGLAFMLNDKMACGVIDTDLMVRVGPAGYTDALAHDHVRPMDFTGRAMRGYVFVTATGCAAPAAVEYWVECAVVNIESLSAPPSESRPPRQPRAANNRRG